MHAARDAKGFEFESALSKIARVLTGQYGVTRGIQSGWTAG
jgi:hypothetical protein